MKVNLMRQALDECFMAFSGHSLSLGVSVLASSFGASGINAVKAEAIDTWFDFSFFLHESNIIGSLGICVTRNRCRQLAQLISITNCSSSYGAYGRDMN